MTLLERILKAIDDKGYLKEFDLIFPNRSIASALSVVVDELNAIQSRVTNVVDAVNAKFEQLHALEQTVATIDGNIGRLADDTGNAIRTTMLPKLSEALSTIELLEAAVEEQRKELDEVKRKLLL